MMASVHALTKSLLCMKRCSEVDDSTGTIREPLVPNIYGAHFGVQAVQYRIKDLSTH